jgi:hypothetical protein
MEDTEPTSGFDNLDRMEFWRWKHAVFIEEKAKTEMLRVPGRNCAGERYKYDRMEAEP